MAGANRIQLVSSPASREKGLTLVLSFHASHKEGGGEAVGASHWVDREKRGALIGREYLLARCGKTRWCESQGG